MLTIALFPVCLSPERSIANYYFVARCPASVPHCTDTTWETWKQGACVAAAVLFPVNADGQHLLDCSTRRWRGHDQLRSLPRERGQLHHQRHLPLHRDQEVYVSHAT